MGRAKAMLALSMEMLPKLGDWCEVLKVPGGTVRLLAESQGLLPKETRVAIPSINESRNLSSLMPTWTTAVRKDLTNLRVRKFRMLWQRECVSPRLI